MAGLGGALGAGGATAGALSAGATGAGALAGTGGLEGMAALAGNASSPSLWAKGLTAGKDFAGSDMGKAMIGSAMGKKDSGGGPISDATFQAQGGQGSGAVSPSIAFGRMSPEERDKVVRYLNGIAQQ